MAESIRLVENDRAPLACTLTDSAGAAVNITGYTITANVGYADGTVLEITATLTAPTSGQFEIPFGAGELVQGTHTIEFSIDDGGGLPFTMPAKRPFDLIVRREIT